LYAAASYVSAFLSSSSVIWKTVPAMPSASRPVKVANG